MIQVKYYPEEFRMRMEGHAGAGPFGQDIVCAGASTLMFTLLEAAQDEPKFSTHAYMNETEATIEVSCYPDAGHERRCRYLFDTIAHGVEMLAVKYPDHIRLGGSYGKH